ncbi:MAG: sigma-E factor negative regulatory protein [Xanthomonadales bacterium]|nr:sigma-E factor negative regulatory protein [Xanthomonadales bacterium]
MTEKSSKDLCCLVDGELSRSESKFMIRRLQNDQALAHKWERYHLVRSVMRGQHPGAGAGGLSGFAESVSRAIDKETAVPRPTKLVDTWLKPAVGMAVAAAVGAGAFLYWVEGQQGPAPAPATLATTVDDGMGGPTFSQATMPASADMGQQRINARMQRLLFQHTQATAPGRPVPYVFFVSQGVQRQQVETENQDTESDEQAVSPR